MTIIPASRPKLPLPALWVEYAIESLLGDAEIDPLLELLEKRVALDVKILPSRSGFSIRRGKYPG